MPFKPVTNIGLYQAGWFICILWPGTITFAYTVFFIVIHTRFIANNLLEWRSTMLIAAIGILWDSGLSLSGILIFDNLSGTNLPSTNLPSTNVPSANMTGPHHDSRTYGILPLWLICLWVMFATTFHHGLRWFQNHLWAGSLCAAIGGPLTYFGGSQISDVELAKPLTLTCITMAIGWAILFPCCALLAKKMYPQPL